jgi:hypothetical protein
MPGPAHAVAVAYLVTLYGGGGVARAQTMAVVTWLLGHVLLALNLRFEREPLSRRALVSNRLMLLWGGVALLTALLATVVPWVHEAWDMNAVAWRGDGRRVAVAKDDGSVIVLGVSEPRSAITQALCRLWGRDWCSPLLGRQPGSAAGSVVPPSYMSR